MNNTQFGRAPIADPNGTESEVNGQGGGAGGISASTRMATPALGGVNWNKINTAASGIGTHVQSIAKSISGDKSLVPAFAKHISNIQNSLKALQSHPSNPANNSEADAGDMSHWDPNAGNTLYPRTQK